MTMADLQREFDFYLSHQDELVTKFNGRFLVIRDERVEGDFATQADAYDWAVGCFPLGTFLLQRCAPGDEAYTQTFCSRVYV